MSVQRGDSLGRYRLEEAVGQGGMAVVYRAVDSVLGRTVAVKVIRPAYTEDGHFLERFLQEARLVASLDHPNILPIYDFGEHAGSPYLVLPYLPGGSLADRIGGRPQPLPRVAAWLVQIAGALDAAHARGVLHRDLKPGNVLVGNDGRLVLGDFGIARLAEASTRLTATGMVVGTPLYMAPELARGADATPASDRYALGVMAFEMLSGSPPFTGLNPLSILHQQVHEPVPSLAGRIPELPGGADDWLQRAMAKEPAARPPSGRALAEELVLLLTPAQRAELSTLVWSGSGEAALARAEAPTAVERGATLRLEPPGAGGAGAASATAAATPLATPVERLRPRRWAWMLGLLGAAAVAAAFLLLPRERSAGGGESNAPPGPPASAAQAGGAAPPPAPVAPAPAAPAVAAAPPARSGEEQVLAPAAPQGGAEAGAEAEDEAPPLPLDDGALAGDAAPPSAPAAALTRQAAQRLRRPARRLEAADFSRVASASAPYLGDPVLGAAFAVGRTWAQGGLAYVAGREDEWRQAQASLAASLGTGSPMPWGIAWPLAAFPREPWGPAALWGDARRELEGQLRPHLGEPRAVLASAYLAHLDGDHAGATRRLLEGGLDPAAGGTADSPLRALAAQLLAAEALETGDVAAARSWRASALAGRSPPLALPFAIEMIGLAAERLGPGEARAVRIEACRAGLLALCPQGAQRRARSGDASVEPGEGEPREPAQRPLGRRRRPPGQATN